MFYYDRFRARMKAKKYGHIISLGYNCEIAFQFFKYYKFLESNLFAWCHIPSLDTLMFTLENFEVLFSGTISEPNPLYSCPNTGIRFHGKTPVESLLKDGVFDEIALNADLDELKQRVTYLKRKFLQSLSDNEKTLFVLKIDEAVVDSNIIEEKLQELYNIITSICKNEFELLVVAEEAFYQENIKKLRHEKIIFRTVKKFAPCDDVTNIKKADRPSWKLIFDEFRPKYKLVKNKNFKFEDK